MEAVRAFNNELSSLYESKPPVSRAKMASVTKCAIKAIKFYKHVVQSVEKFIQKCKPEYKLPGLYVIDSIVRQSRHQFGPEKDVFSPRFTKNIVATFTNLFKCPVEERDRVVRVLNLWQKNSVFPLDIIQSLLDLAIDPDKTELIIAAQRAADAAISISQKVALPGPQPTSNGQDSNSNPITQQTEMLSTITKLLQQAQEGTIINTAPESQLQQLQHLQQQLVMQTERISKPQQQQQQQQPAPPIDSNLLAQIQVLTNQLLTKTSGGSTNIVEEPSKQNSVEPLFNKKLLDFDYGDSDEDDDREDHNQQPQQIQLPQQLQPQQLQSQQPQQLPPLPQQLPPQQLQLQQHPQQLPPQQPPPPQQMQPHQQQPSPQQLQSHQQPPPPQQMQPQQQQPPPQQPPPQQLQPQQLQPHQQQLPPQHLQSHQQLQPHQQQPPQHMQPQQLMPHQQQLMPPQPYQQQLPPHQQQLPPQLQSYRQQQPHQLPPQHLQPHQQQLPPQLQPHQQQPPPQMQPHQQQPPPQLQPHQQQPPPQLQPHQQQPPPQLQPHQQQPPPQLQPHQQQLPPQLQPHQQQNQHEQKHLISTQGVPIAVPEQSLMQQIQQMSKQQEQLQSEIGAQDQLRRRLLEQQQQQFDREIEQESLSHHSSQEFNQEKDRRQDDDRDDRDRDNRESRERTEQRRRRDSRDRSPRRRSRRSRSRSRDRRRRSRSRDRHKRSRSRERERRERERERERRKVGLPPIKGKYISICSTTIWFGRLTKHTTEDELREHIEKYGVIRTINMIPPRGCAFVCLTKRKDAFKALDRLKGEKINGNVIKVAWAPGVGVKESTFKDLWDVDLGVTYIPWDQLPKDVTPLLSGGMVDEESLPERLKGMKTGEEEDEIQPEQKPIIENEEVRHEESTQQPPPPPLPMNMPGQLPNFPLPGQNPLAMMGPGGPLSLLSGPPPPIGIRPGMGVPLGMGSFNNMGGPNTMVNHNNMMLPNNMNSLHHMGNPNINPMAGFRGPMPNLPGMGPRPMMNMGPQGPMMGGQGGHIGGLGGGVNPNMDSPGLRGPFGPFPNMPRFPPMQGPGGMPPTSVNNESHGGDHTGMGDSDMRAIAEPKEWPPDDEVNAEDEADDHHMDSDDRMLPMGMQQHMPGSGMPNLQTIGNPFGLRGPMLPGQGPPNPMLGIPRVPSPNSGMPPLISFRMMPPPQQQPVHTLSGNSAPGFSLAPGGVMLPMPAAGIRQGIVPTVTTPRLLPPPTGAPVSVSVNGSVVVTRPDVPVSDEGAESPAESSEVPSSEEDKATPHPSGPVPVIQIHGSNCPPSGPVLGRGFAPMTIRPRSGPGLLGVRPAAQGGAGFNRFGGPRPAMGPTFGGLDRPPFTNRFGTPLRPPVGFLDQDEREDRDERKPLPRIDVDDQAEVGNVSDQSPPKDIDERRDSNKEKGRNQDVDMRQDIDERSKSGHTSSRWCNTGVPDDTTKSAPIAGLEGKPTDDVSGGNTAGGSAIAAPSIAEGTPVAKTVQSATANPPIAGSQVSVITKIDSVSSVSADGSTIIKTDGSGVVDGASDTIQSSRPTQSGDKTSS